MGLTCKALYAGIIKIKFVAGVRHTYNEVNKCLEENQMKIEGIGSHLPKS